MAQMLTRNKIVSITIIILLFVSALPLVVQISSENVSAAPDTHTWDGGGANVFAGTHANWVGDVAPEAGDSVVFNAGALPCTWNLSIALNSWTMGGTFSGVVTLAANFSITSYSQVAGTVTASTSYTVVDSGDFSQIGGVLTSNKLNLKMFSGDINVSLVDLYLNSLEVVGDVVVNGYTQTNHLTIGPGATLNLALGGHFYWHPATASYIYSNQGTITGMSPFTIWLTGGFVPSIYPLGDIDCPFAIERTASTQGGSPPATFILASDTHLGNSFSIKSYNAVATMTVATGNFDLSATSITVGVRGVLSAGSSMINCSGYFNSSAGAFVQGTCILNMVGGQSTNLAASWMANATGSITFTIPNLEDEERYDVYVDGTYLFPGYGPSFNFTYSGPWSEHFFEIRMWLPPSSSLGGSDLILMMIGPVTVLMVVVSLIGYIGGVMTSVSKAGSQNKGRRK